MGLGVSRSRGAVTLVQGLKEETVHNPEEIYALMLLGAKNRAISETDMNEHSSRSHTIFQLTLEQEDSSRPGHRLLAKLNLVDLAGSEKWRHAHYGTTQGTAPTPLSNNFH